MIVDFLRPCCASSLHLLALTITTAHAVSYDTPRLTIMTPLITEYLAVFAEFCVYVCMPACDIVALYKLERRCEGLVPFSLHNLQDSSASQYVVDFSRSLFGCVVILILTTNNVVSARSIHLKT